MTGQHSRTERSRYHRWGDRGWMVGLPLVVQVKAGEVAVGKSAAHDLEGETSPFSGEAIGELLEKIL